MHNETRDEQYLLSIKNYIKGVVYGYNNKKGVDYKFNKYQMMAFNKKGFKFQSEEYTTADQCSCTLFPYSNK